MATPETTVLPGSDVEPGPEPTISPAPALGASPPKTKQTQFALKAMGLAGEFHKACGRLRVAGPLATFRVEIAAPDGPSTGGGKQAVQHIKLVPDVGTTIVMGQANLRDSSAELRSYEYLAQMHARRFKGQPLPFARDAYDALSAQVAAFFSDRRLRLTIVSPPVGSVLPDLDGPPAARTPWAGIVITLVVIAVLALALLRMGF
jgi:hypothetical protein